MVTFSEEKVTPPEGKIGISTEYGHGREKEPIPPLSADSEILVGHKTIFKRK